MNEIDLRATMLSVVGGLLGDFERRLDYRLREFEQRFDGIHRQVIELQADVSLCLDRLDRLEVEVSDLRKRSEVRFDDVDREVRDIRAQFAKMNREGMRDRSRYEDVVRRVEVIELKVSP